MNPCYLQYCTAEMNCHKWRCAMGSNVLLDGIHLLCKTSEIKVEITP